MGRLGLARGRAWALAPLGSLVVVIAAIRLAAGTAEGLTYLALTAVPPLAAAAPLIAMRRRLPPPAAAATTVALFALAWIDRDGLVGEAAAGLLSALSAVTLGVVLAALTPPSWLKVGIVLMAIGDAYLVVSDLLRAPNDRLLAASPGAGLPRLQAELFGSVSLGYGDLFAAAVLGAVMVGEGRRTGPVALLTFAIAGLFDLLFLAVTELPATVPVALALVVVEIDARAGTRGRFSARWSPSRPGGGTPRPGT